MYFCVSVNGVQMPASSGYGSKRNRLRDRVAYVRTDCNFTPDMSVSSIDLIIENLKMLIQFITHLKLSTLIPKCSSNFRFVKQCSSTHFSESLVLIPGHVIPKAELMHQVSFPLFITRRIRFEIKLIIISTYPM